MQRRYYVLWLVAIFLAEIGGATDVSYHFGHLFDTISPPHLTAATGVCLMVTLLFWALVRERDRVGGLERAALLVGAAALSVGILDEPFDLLWHRIFGVDISLWSPTHLMLNYPADVLNVCLVTAFLASPAVRGRWGWLIAFAICLRNVMTTQFPLYQQEYGAVGLDGLARTGHSPWYIEPAMLALIGTRAGQLVTGGAPDWLYLIYFALAGGYALSFCAVVLARRRTTRNKNRGVNLGMWPWSTGAATALALCFILWRIVFRQIFLAVHQAHGVVPWYLVPMGVTIDLTLLFGPRIVRPLVATYYPTLLPHLRLVVAALSGVLVALVLYGGMELMRATYFVVPAAPPLALPFACLTGALGVLLGTEIATRVRERVDESRASAKVAPVRERVPVLAGRGDVWPGLLTYTSLSQRWTRWTQPGPAAHGSPARAPQRHVVSATTSRMRRTAAAARDLVRSGARHGR
jgi:hypothetical protein